MPCETCKLWSGISVEHDECPLRAGLVCRRCCSSGHTSSECNLTNNALPTCLEDLIAADVREQFKIMTRTEYCGPPGSDIVGHDVRRVDIINQDKWIREFMRDKKLQTARKREENLAKIMEWANGRGLNIRLLNQEAV